MTTVAVSLAEITRVGPWAFRALGYPFGVADRATRILVWTEAVHGLGLKLLRLGEQQITQTATFPAPQWTKTTDGGRIIDSAGKCLFEVGPTAVDLATRDCRETGVGHVTVTGAVGICLVGALCDLVIHRNLGVVVTFASGSNEIAPDVFSRSGWLAGFKAGSETYIFGGSLNDDVPRILSNLARTPLQMGDAETQRLMADWELARSSGSGGSGYVSFLTLPCDTASLWRTPTEADVSVCGVLLPETDNLKRLEQAYQHGVIVKRADFENLYALEQRTWAPSSDRSRAQAGF